MEAEMKMVFQQKVQEKEAKLKQSEEELYARHREMKEALEKQRAELEDKKRRLESGRPLTPEKASVSGGKMFRTSLQVLLTFPSPSRLTANEEEGLPAYLDVRLGSLRCGITPCLYFHVSFSSSLPSSLGATLAAALAYFVPFIYRFVSSLASSLMPRPLLLLHPSSTENREPTFHGWFVPFCSFLDCLFLLFSPFYFR